MNLKIIIIGVILIVALIVLPTLTPEDLITTIPLIAILGWWGFAFLCFIILIILWYVGILPKFLGLIRGVIG